jgi:hypothetical protein
MLGRFKLATLTIATPLVMAVPAGVDLERGFSSNECFGENCITFFACQCCEPPPSGVCHWDKCPVGGDLCCGW